MVDTTAVSVQGDNKHIEMWKIKKLIYKLENCKGLAIMTITMNLNILLTSIILQKWNKYGFLGYPPKRRYQQSQQVADW